jgi:hypothetical protein
MDLRNGTHVYWISDTGLTDTSAVGVVTDAAPIDPSTGQPNDEMRWVSWPEGEDLVSIDNLVRTDRRG